jgi:hypothetical protein
MLTSFATFSLATVWLHPESRDKKIPQDMGPCPEGPFIFSGHSQKADNHCETSSIPK